MRTPTPPKSRCKPRLSFVSSWTALSPGSLVRRCCRCCSCRRHRRCCCCCVAAVTASAGCRTLAHVGRQARTHSRSLARSLSACDARRSVLPSKLVALATLSSDLNMVAPMLKTNVRRFGAASAAVTGPSHSAAESGVSGLQPLLRRDAKNER